VGGADDHGLVVGKQDRRAVGGENSEKKVRPVGDHCIDSRSLALLPRLIRDDQLGGMDLVNSREVRFGKQCSDCYPPVAGDGLAIVIASKADIFS